MMTMSPVHQFNMGPGSLFSQWYYLWSQTVLKYGGFRVYKETLVCIPTNPVTQMVYKHPPASSPPAGLPLLQLVQCSCIPLGLTSSLNHTICQQDTKILINS